MVLTTLGKIVRKNDQNVPFSPIFFQISRFEKKLLILRKKSEFWRKRQILRTIFSRFFPA
jgi:hypothetical protein